MAVAQAKEPMRIVDLPIIAAGEDAAAAVIKRELARELHDQVAQHLTSVLVQMQCAKREHRRASDVADQFTDLEASVREVLNNVREILSDLRGQPGIADRFVDAVRSDLISKFQSRTGIKVVLSVARAWPASLPPESVEAAPRSSSVPQSSEAPRVSGAPLASEAARSWVAVAAAHR